MMLTSTLYPALVLVLLVCTNPTTPAFPNSVLNPNTPICGGSAYADLMADSACNDLNDVLASSPPQGSLTVLNTVSVCPCLNSISYNDVEDSEDLICLFPGLAFNSSVKSLWTQCHSLDFCSLYASICPSHTQYTDCPSEDFLDNHGITEAGTWLDSGASFPENTLMCRMVQLVRAANDGSQTSTSCDSASPSGGHVCIDIDAEFRNGGTFFSESSSSKKGKHKKSAKMLKEGLRESESVKGKKGKDAPMKPKSSANRRTLSLTGNSRKLDVAFAVLCVATGLMILSITGAHVYKMRQGHEASQETLLEIVDRDPILS
eukprot:m.65976 g.65976  ORF g.65976 m.65976 type:complete len:318 (-) comp11775_c0_seq1:2398-3351(-)